MHCNAARTHARTRALQRRTYARTPERTTERTLTRAHTPIHTLALRDELWMLSRVTFSRRSDRFALSSLTLLSRSTPPSVDDESVTHTAGKIPTLPFWPTLPEKRDREVKRNDGCEQQVTKQLARDYIFLGALCDGHFTRFDLGRAYSREVTSAERHCLPRSHVGNCKSRGRGVEVELA